MVKPFLIIFMRSHANFYGRGVGGRGVGMMGFHEYDVSKTKDKVHT